MLIRDFMNACDDAITNGPAILAYVRSGKVDADWRGMNESRQNEIIYKTNLVAFGAGIIVAALTGSFFLGAFTGIGLGVAAFSYQCYRAYNFAVVDSFKRVFG